MSKWITIQPSQIIKLSFKSIWFHKKHPHTIDAFDYGNCKIKIRKHKFNNGTTIKTIHYDEAKHL